MRILYLQTIRLDTDLCRTSRLGLTGALAASGCDVTLIAGCEHARPSMPDGVRLIAIRLLPLPFVGKLWFNLAAHFLVLIETIWRRPAVIVVDPYTFHAAFPFDVASALGLISTRIVMDIRSGIFHQQHRGAANLPRRILRSVSLAYARRVFTGFTTITPMLRDVLVERFSLPAERIGIWESAVDENRGNIAASPGRPAGLRVLYHGALSADRGLKETIDAMRLVAARRPEVEFVVLGSGTEERSLRAAAAGLTNVSFHPPVPHREVGQFLADCDVGILPFQPTLVMRASRPLKLMEYLAAGKPVIASRIEAVADVVGPDGAVFLTSVTAEAIADAILWAADHRQELVALGERGRSLVDGRFTWPRQAEQLRQFFLKIGAPAPALTRADV